MKTILAFLTLIAFVLACNPTSTGLTDAEKTAIVARHNYYRNLIASGKVSGFPAATNMNELTWSDNIGNFAQGYTNNCPMGHNPALQKVGYGENWYYSGSSSKSFDINSPVDDWYSEINQFSGSQIKQNYNDAMFNEGTGHFTQVIWAATTQIGCGKVQYKSQGFYNTIVICDYSPAGNFMGEKIYKAGTAASQCQQKSGSLCVTNAFSESFLARHLKRHRKN